MDGSDSASERAVALAQAGAVADAHALLEQAIAAGDGLAAATLADWRMAGQIVRRDIAAAQALYGRAVALGVEAATGPYLALLASGPGGAARDWPGTQALLAARSDSAARQQVRLLEAMDLTDTGDPRRAPGSHPLCSSPRIAALPAFLTGDECRYLIDLATPQLQPSQVVDPHSGRLIHDPVRTARAAAFALVFENPALHAINRRIAAATGTAWAQGEPAQVLCYRPGEEYKLHSDALPPGMNQRTVTVLVALNDDYDGGETLFPAIGLAWRGRPGDALVFRNVDLAGAADPAARHAGCPVRRGTKFLLSRWIRERPLDLSGPPGKPF
ncbi:MAG TPA: 2OG-Fe(II) oxygenase [Croceibacterium sp.]